MSRPLRIEFPGAVYHITGRGNARRRIYRDDDDWEQFLSVLAHVVGCYGWLCHAYCLMDNHYHLLIETPKANLEARKKYRAFVGEGLEAPSPWERLQGQIYLGGEDFVKEHQPDRVIREVPRRQSQAHRPELKELLGAKASLDSETMEAYGRYGYRMSEIAEHLEVHYSTVSRRLRRAEKRDA